MTDRPPPPGPLPEAAPAPTSPPTASPGAGQPGLRLRGVYFDGRSSRDHRATLSLEAGEVARLQVLPEAGATGAAPVPLPDSGKGWPLAQLGFEPALGRARRVILLPGGGRFETADDAGVSALEARLGRNRGLRGVRRLESNWGLALGVTALMAGVVWAFLTYGLPAVARSAAAATPSSVLVGFDDQASRLLEKDYLGPSQLPAARQAQLQAEFARITRWAGGSYPYRLLLRDGEPNGDGIGPNALALPNGTIIMTDQLVELSSNDRELVGVLAHEAAHVTKRHTLTQVYQGMGMALVIAALTGDVVSAGNFAVALPAALLRRGYSRGAESESDRVAGRYLMERYGSTKPLRDLLARLETGDKAANEHSVKSEGGRGSDLLQSHPGTALRIEELREIERAAKAGGKP